MNGALLVVFNLVDQYMLDREEKEREGSQLEEVMVHEPLRLRGWHNLFFLGGVVLVVLGKGQGWGMGGDEWPFGLQEGLMAALAVAAYASTRTEIRSSNRFSFAPIVEVAVLFAGIFVTMVAPLLILNKLGQTKALVITQSWHIHINVTQPWQFFWAAGALSSFLDNAPTYMTFAATACGTQGWAWREAVISPISWPGGPRPRCSLPPCPAGPFSWGPTPISGTGRISW